MVESAKLIDRYQVESRLAVGGMGSVYSATDERLGRRVAIKVLKDDLADDARFVERFRREARAAAALSHPNVGAVYDYGQDDGTHFIVMELVEGRDLARLLREEGPLSPERAVSIATQICGALSHAHAAGVIHRDIKPANIIVGPGDRVKVTDFGIARATGDSTLTATGSVLGSAHYLSPEQAAGLEIGPRSDLYSLGVVVYEMLTGALPFTGDSPVAVAVRHINDELPAPSSLNDEVPPRLDEVVARATAKAPDDRFRDANDMGAALSSSLGGDRSEPAFAQTAVLETGVPTTAEQTVWPIPGTRWDPQRVGRTVIWTLLLLALIAASLLVVRLVTDDDDPPAKRRRAGGAAPAIDTPTPTPSPTPTPEPTRYELKDDLIGIDQELAEQLLTEAGFVVEFETVDPQDFGFDEDTEGGVVVGSEPPIGSVVELGDTITLYISEEPDKEHVPPGQEKKEEDED